MVAKCDHRFGKSQPRRQCVEPAKLANPVISASVLRFVGARFGSVKRNATLIPNICSVKSYSQLFRVPRFASQLSHKEFGRNLRHASLCPAFAVPLAGVTPVTPLSNLWTVCNNGFDVCRRASALHWSIRRYDQTLGEDRLALRRSRQSRSTSLQLATDRARSSAWQARSRGTAHFDKLSATCDRARAADATSSVEIQVKEPAPRRELVFAFVAPLGVDRAMINEALRIALCSVDYSLIQIHASRMIESFSMPASLPQINDFLERKQRLMDGGDVLRRRFSEFFDDASRGDAVALACLTDSLLTRLSISQR